MSMSVHEGHVAGLSQSSTIVVGGDGTFRPLPAKRALTDGDDTSGEEKFRVTTVFAADGRFVHLRKPAGRGGKESRSPPRPSPSQTRCTACTDTLVALAPEAQPQASQAGSAVWTLQKSGCIEVRMPQTATGSDPVSCNPASGSNTTPSESWLDSRLARNARAQPLHWGQRIVRIRDGQGQDDLEDDVPSASLEVKISKRSPSSFKESSASLKIKAPSMQTLDRIIMDSVDGLVAEMRPALA